MDEYTKQILNDFIEYIAASQEEYEDLSVQLVNFLADYEWKMEKAKIILYSLIALLVITIGAVQVHEYQHYQDFKHLNCTNISYQIVRVMAYCEGESYIKAQNLSQYRDEQFLRLWI